MRRQSERIAAAALPANTGDRKSTRLNSSHRCISYAVFCLKKHTSELQSPMYLVCRLLLEKAKIVPFFLPAFDISVPPSLPLISSRFLEPFRGSEHDHHYIL